MAKLQFQWDKKKAKSNKKKHGVSFQDATTLFNDPKLFTKQDTRHDYGEDRFVSVGKSNIGALLAVHTPRGEETRLISARKPTRRERAWYKFW